MKKLSIILLPTFFIILLIITSIFVGMLTLLFTSRTGSAQEFRSANVEFNPLAIDEDRCPGVMVFPGTRSGSHNAYYYLVKPYPKMNIDFEDVAYVPSFRKEGDSRAFFYAIYFPSYNETNPFDDYADIPCGKDQLKREITKVLPSHDRPEDPDDINLSRLKINTLSFSIPQYYRDLGFDLIYDESLSSSQNAGVIYSRGTFILELRVPDMEFERLLEVLRSDVGFPLSIKMGFRAKEQLDYKEVYVDIGRMMSELKAKLGGSSQEYFAKAELSSAIKSTRSFAEIDIYGETSNIDGWISDVLIPLLSSYSSGNKTTSAPKPSSSGSYKPYVPYTPYPKPSPPSSGGSSGASGNNMISIDLSGKFESDVKKFTFRSDVLNPNASQEYLVYQYPLRYYGELDGNYFVLESNRYEENDRYSQIYLNAGETLEFSIEGYWEVTPKLIRHNGYFTQDHLASGEVPYIFTKDNPQFKIEDSTGELYIYGMNLLIPGSAIGGQLMGSYAKIGRVSIKPVSWGNGYFPKYFNWDPVFPANGREGVNLKHKSLKGTNLFDIKVPVNNLRPYGVEDLLKMIPLGIRFWKGHALAVSDILSDEQGDLYEEVSRDYFEISYSHIRKTVILTAKRSGHLYFENLDFAQPSIEIVPRDITDPNRAPGKNKKYIAEDDFIKIDQMLFKEIARKDFQKITENAEKKSRRGVYQESWKPLQYDYVHAYPSGLAQALRRHSRISREVFYPLKNPTIEKRTYIKLKLFDK